MDIYTDYGNWKFENYDFINMLVSKQSKSISRFTQVIAVVDYLYEKRVKNGKDLDIDEETIFDTGFNYIHDHFLTLQNFYEKVFNKDIDAFEKCSKSINLVLYINDFESELMQATDNIDKDMNALEELEDKVLQTIEKKENVKDTMFAYLDDITIPMFERHNIEIYTVEQIFYDIAIEYGIYQENDFNIFNEVFNNQIESHRKKG